MSSSSAKMSKTEEILAQAQKAFKGKTSTKTEEKQEAAANDERFANIGANTFYKIMFSEELELEGKKQEVAKSLTYAENKEESLARLKEFEVFKAFLQEQRTQMASAIIELTDSDAFAELQSTYMGFNDALLEFEDSMKPLTDILDAVYSVRMAGDEAGYNIFKQIKDDKAAEEAFTQLRTEQDSQFQNLANEINSTNNDIITLEQDKTWFGFGNIRQNAREEIARKRTDIDAAKEGLSTLEVEIQEASTQEEARLQDASKFAKEKEKLRELLDLTSDEHKGRQRALIDSARNFIHTTKTRTLSVKGHLEGMSGQIRNLANANGQMTDIYSVMSEAEIDALKNNERLHDTFSQAAEGETSLHARSRERKKEGVGEYVQAVRVSSVGTTTTLADLSDQMNGIKAMKDANNLQVYKTELLSTSGIAGVADNLVKVVQGVSGAALNEAAEMAYGTLKNMKDQTRVIEAQEALSAAMGVKDENDKLESVIESLAQTQDVYDQSRELYQEGVKENLKIVDMLSKQAKELQDSFKKSVAVDAEMLKERDGNEDDHSGAGTKAPKVSTANPFNFNG